MLIAARISQDLACCSRAMARARSKCAFAFAASGSGIMSANFARRSVDLSLAPVFLGCFRRCHRFANVAPRLLELPSSAYARGGNGPYREPNHLSRREENVPGLGASVTS